MAIRELWRAACLVIILRSDKDEAPCGIELGAVRELEQAEKFAFKTLGESRTFPAQSGNHGDREGCMANYDKLE